MLIDQAIRFALIRRNLPSPPCRLLDVGCGSGNLAEFLAREGYSVDACDRSPHSPFGNRDAGVRYFQADGAKLQVPDQAYDCTISCDVLEHVVPADRDAFIAEMFRVTKDGGKVVFTVFLRNTLSFRLWGAMSLLLYGKLPQWYIEHITIPLPDIAAIHKSIDRSGTMLHFERYQACLNLLAYCVQQMIPHWRAERLGEQIAPLVHRLDVVGARTSGLFVANRAGLGGH